jgi:hypothetical protein
MNFIADEGLHGRIFPPTRKEGWTYFVQVVAPDGPVKIGKANNVADRFRSLQGGNHCELRFLGALPHDEIPERMLHDIFRAWHLRGEWFRPCEVILSLADLGNRHFAGEYKSPRGRRAPCVRDISQRLTIGPKPSAEDIIRTLALHA